MQGPQLVQPRCLPLQRSLHWAARAILRCSICLADDHTPSNAHKTQDHPWVAWMPVAAAPSLPPGPPQRSGELCKRFQKDECKVTQHSCKFTHMCQICGSWLHGAKFCGASRRRSSSPLGRPPPAPGYQD